MSETFSFLHSTDTENVDSIVEESLGYIGNHWRSFKTAKFGKVCREWLKNQSELSKIILWIRAILILAESRRRAWRMKGSPKIGKNRSNSAESFNIHRFLKRSWRIDWESWKNPGESVEIQRIRNSWQECSKSPEEVDPTSQKNLLKFEECWRIRNNRQERKRVSIAENINRECQKNPKHPTSRIDRLKEESTGVLNNWIQFWINIGTDNKSTNRYFNSRYCHD